MNWRRGIMLSARYWNVCCRPIGALMAAAIVVMSMACASDSMAQAANRQESDQVKIARALSAGPENITRQATVAEPDSQGGMRTLRPGTNDFTCMPGDPKGIGMPPMCADKVAMQWNSDFDHHLPKPTTTLPGVEYMLAGATQRSD